MLFVTYVSEHSDSGALLIKTSMQRGKQIDGEDLKVLNLKNLIRIVKIVEIPSYQAPLSENIINYA